MTISAALDSAHGIAFALRTGDGQVHVRRASAAGRDSERLVLPLIAGALAEHDLHLPQVRRWSVGTGPGSFCGIRIGIATVRGVCRWSGAAIRGVPSSLALALAGRRLAPAAARVAVLLDARRGQGILTVYEPVGGSAAEEWREIRPPAVVDAAALADVVRLGGTAVVALAGDPVAALLDGLAGALRVTLDGVDAAELLDPPGWAWPADGEPATADLEPVYVRPAVFVEARPPRDLSGLLGPG